MQYEVHFSGRVQGVGFRYTTASVARDLDVMGYVCNLSDGRVQLVAEGDPDELDRLVRGVQQRMHAYIADTQIERRAASGEFKGFGIRH